MHVGVHVIVLALALSINLLMIIFVECEPRKCQICWNKIYMSELYHFSLSIFTFIWLVKNLRQFTWLIKILKPIKK